MEHWWQQLWHRKQVKKLNAEFLLHQLHNQKEFREKSFHNCLGESVVYENESRSLLFHKFQNEIRGF